MNRKKKLSPREAIWAWFQSYKLPRRRYPKNRHDRSRDNDTYRCVLRMDGHERLVIGVWRSCKAVPVGVYYMTKSGLFYTTRDGVNWHTEKHDHIAHNGYGFYDHNDEYVTESEEDECRPWAVEVGKAVEGYDYSRTDGRYDTLRIIDSIETEGSRKRRERTLERKRESINNWATKAPALPADFDAWVRSVPFGGEHFQFFDKKKAVFGCSACGGEAAEKSPEAKDWRRGQTVTCPTCGAVGKVIRHGSTWEQERRERVMLVQAYRDRKGKPCAVARHFEITMHWKSGAERWRLSPTVLIALPTDGTPAKNSDVYYNTWYDWSDKNPHNQCAGEGYCYPDLSAIAGTAYTGMGLEVAAAKGWKMNWNGLMRDSHGDPRMEYLIKGNFRRLVADFADRCMPNNYLKPTGKGASTAADILGLDGQGVARLRQHNGGAAHLVWLRDCTGCNMRKNLDTGEMRMVNERLPDAIWDWLVENDITPMKLSRMRDPTVGNLSLEQIMNYINRQTVLYRESRRRGEREYRCSYACSDVEKVRLMWVDTLEMGMKLKLDFSRSMNVRPPNLKARHDELLEIINAEKKRLEAEAAEELFPEVAPTCERIRATYEWGDGVHKVVVPTGVYDIQREGRLLHHCVAANERYLDRIAEGESYILFLRRASAPDTPWYTMEVEPGGKIRQLRTTGDSDGMGSDRDEAKAFLKEWSKAVRARCSSEELLAAEVARKKRLRNFDELREGGNIIRNGTLRGRLLVDILERDFRELNAPEQNESEENAS